jgi:hypothetical protein
LNEVKAGYCSGFRRTVTLTSSPGSRSPRKISDLSFLLSDIGSETNLKELSRDLESFIEELKKETPSLYLTAHIRSDLGENPQETIIALRSKTIELAKREAEDIVQSMGGKLGKVVSLREADVDFSGKTMIELNEFIRGPYTAEGFKQVTFTSKMIVQFEFEIAD